MASAGVLGRRLVAGRALARRAAAPRAYATLVMAEHNNKTLAKSTLHSITAAKQLKGSERLDVLVLGQGCGAVAQECAAIDGVGQVLVAEDAQFEHPVADTAADIVEKLAKARGYGVVAGSTSTLCKEILPRVAAKLDVQPISDVVAVGDEEGVFVRPMYAGNAMATVKSKDAVKLVTFRPTAFEAAGAAASAAAVESVPSETHASCGIQWMSDSEAASDKPQLSSCNRVVSGGRALKSGENFEKVLEPLCDKLKAAMGASRAAVDAGFVPNELQVGQTGKVVAPDLYIAVGISGAIQHLAGMKDSKTIVAINKDPDAPIFQVSDYGLVCDLFEAVPEMTGKV